MQDPVFPAYNSWVQAMQTFLILLVCSSVLLAPSFSRAAEANADARSNRADGMKRYVVMLQRTANQDGCAADHAIERSRTFRHAINGFVAVLKPSAVDRLKKDSRVREVIEDWVSSTNTGQLVPTGVRRIAADFFPSVKIDGTDKRVDVDVAVIDSGIQADHPDLNVVNSVAFRYGSQTGDLVDSGNSHGTECAGIIGALDNSFGVVGIVPGARLWSIRNSVNGGSYFSDDMASFDYAAQHADEIEVVSCSFGTIHYGYVSNGRESYRAAISALVNQGVVVVASAGNSGADIAGPDGALDSYWDDEVLPAALAEVMAVSAMNPLTDQFASFSNFSDSRHAVSYVNSPGGAIDVAAPGVGISTTVINSGYTDLFNGTSAACPHAAGLVALYIATHGRATNAAGVYAIRQAIVDAALPQPQWHAINTLDPDTFHEGLAVASLAWATNAPQLLNIVKASSGANVSFSSKTGYVHALQFVDTLLLSNQWTTLATTNGNDGPMTMLDSMEFPSRFYRLASEPVRWPYPGAWPATNLGSVGAAGEGVYYSTEHETIGAIASEVPGVSARFPIEHNGAHVEISYLPELNPSEAFSIELWLRPAQTSVYGVPASSFSIANYAPNTPRVSGWALWQYNSSSGSGNGFHFFVYNTSSDTAPAIAAANLNLDTNAWYHLVGTYDGGRVSLFLNGVNVATIAMSSHRPNNSAPMCFGVRSAGAFTLPFRGNLDEAAFYTNALSAAQVLTHYQAGTNPTPPIPYPQVILNDNPGGYWRFDEQ